MDANGSDSQWYSPKGFAGGVDDKGLWHLRLCLFVAGLECADQDSAETALALS
jgi:hypothetical protein